MNSLQSTPAEMATATVSASKFKKAMRAVQRGFTMVELAIVVAVLGILAAVIFSNSSGSTDGVKALNYVTAASKLANSWKMFTQTAGVSTLSTNTALFASGKNAADVLIGGRANVATAYQPAYDASKIVPLTDIFHAEGANWLLDKSRVQIVGGGIAGSVPTVTTTPALNFGSLTFGGSMPLFVVYSDVPDTVVLEIARKFNPSLNALTTGSQQMINTNVIYHVGTNGVGSVAILRIIN